MKHILVILTSIAMVGTLVASFSGNARADNGQIAASMLGGNAAGTNFGAAATRGPITSHRSVSSLFTLSLIAIGRGASWSGTTGDKPGCGREYRFATEVPHPLPAVHLRPALTVE